VVYTGLRSDSIKNHASRNEARRITATHIIFTRISCTLFTYDMYMCRLRHINDPVLSSLKMEGIRLLYFILYTEGLICVGQIFKGQVFLLSIPADPAGSLILQFATASRGRLAS
jgi:hypothetical protein